MDAATRNHIRFRRSEIISQRLNCGVGQNRNGRPVMLDFEQEVDAALAAFRKDGPWPPIATVPSTRGRAAYRFARAVA